MNILISGVGGQGTLLASRVLGKYALEKGFDCKLSEVHGMAQRGGSVVTHVKIGEKIYSPLVEEGDADIVISFEKLEALRSLPFLKKDGIMIYSTQKILPMPVIIGAAEYPQTQINNAYSLDADGIAEKLGNKRVANTVMLGLFTRLAKFDYEVMKKSLKECVPEKAMQINMQAFDTGYNQ